MPEPSGILFEDWGLIDYEKALALQLDKVQHVSENPHHGGGILVFCTHPPVVTLGRKTQSGDVTSWNGPLIEVSRGGRATYHGPSQLVVYPILKINDIGKYLRTFENGIIQTLQSYRIEAVGKTFRQKSSDLEATEETGVWVGDRKIASLGVAIKKWITYHGAAINLDEDAHAFHGMKPCGFQPETMISLEKILGRKVDREDFSRKLKDHLIHLFNAPDKQHSSNER